MPADRLLRILSRLGTPEHAEAGRTRLCDVSAEVTAMTGAGIMLMSGGANRGSVCSSNAASALIEELQYTLGEGPCVDAYRQDRPIFEPDLAHPAVSRWIAFSPRALAAGARAVFGFPLQVGAIRLGALNLYRDRPGPMDDEQHADALVMASVAARGVLSMQATAGADGLAAQLEAGADFRYVVHQAAGMVSAQLEVTVAEALTRLQAYAFANDLLISDVADEVVSRRLRFE